MDTLREVLDPNFILRNSAYVSLLIGFVCPLVGMYLILRRLIFLGVALPQISSAGIAFVLFLPTIGIISPHLAENERMLAFVGALGFTVAAILFLAFLERRGRGMVEGRIAIAYVLAGAWSVLLLVKNPMGERGMLDLLRGEIIAVSNADLILTLAAFTVIVASLLVFQKEFLLVSYDRDMAVTLRKNVLFWDTYLFLLIGLTLSVSVLTVGPMVTFGFLMLPPLTAHLFASNMRQFAFLASVIGGVNALAGFILAYRLDYPVGPTDVALLGVVYGLGFLVKKTLFR